MQKLVDLDLAHEGPCFLKKSMLICMESHTFLISLIYPIGKRKLW